MNDPNLQQIFNNNQQLMEYYREYCRMIYSNNMMMNPNQNFFGFNNYFMNSINYNANNCNFNNNTISSMNSLSTNMSTMSLENKDEIQIKFAFINTQTFLVKCKIKEKLSEVINRFKKTQCPKQFKDLLEVPIHAAEKVDINKTVSELQLKNNDIILFASTKGFNWDEVEKKRGQEYQLQEDEKIQLTKWLDEYQGSELFKQIKNSLNDNEQDNNNDNIPPLLQSKESVKKFLEFIMERECKGSIEVKEHPHKLVYCISILNWTCSICHKNYEKTDAKYYCSLCDYYMCDKCHSKGNYTKKKVFPDGIKPSNPDIKYPILKSNHHEHNLIYCRSSRSVVGYSLWCCDVCHLDFDNDIWSFYCTQCDFDLCSKCAGFN